MVIKNALLVALLTLPFHLAEAQIKFDLGTTSIYNYGQGDKAIEFPTSPSITIRKEQAPSDRDIRNFEFNEKIGKNETYSNKAAD